MMNLGLDLGFETLSLCVWAFDTVVPCRVDRSQKRSLVLEFQLWKSPWSPSSSEERTGHQGGCVVCPPIYSQHVRLWEAPIYTFRFVKKALWGCLKLWVLLETEVTGMAQSDQLITVALCSGLVASWCWTPGE